jgi:hypothetical protein
MTQQRSNPILKLAKISKISNFGRLLKDTAELLTGEREERFEFERAIRLLEFRTWIYWPLTNKPSTAGMMAAAIILENIEEDIFCDESDTARREADPDPEFGSLIDLDDKPNSTSSRINALRSNKAYRQVHDYIFAKRGGLMRLLYSPSPKEFDAEVSRRRETATGVADLIDYRLRHA